MGQGTLRGTKDMGQGTLAETKACMTASQHKWTLDLSM